MMKIIGIVMISISCILIGVLYYLKLKYRPEELELFISIISIYEKELRWSQKSFLEVLNCYEKENNNDYLKKAKELLKTSSAVNSFITDNELFEKFHFVDDDIKILNGFFNQSGRLSLEAEIDLCNKTLKALELLKQEAQAKFKRLGLFSVKLSLIFVLWILILLV